MRAAVVLVLITGCNQLLGLQDPTLLDPHLTCTKPGDADYHDEDGDTFPDDCDNCPGIANPGQEDVLEVNNMQAADGVGDACDPSPSTTGDTLARFITFGGMNDQAIVHGFGGSWNVANDELSIDGALDAGDDAELSFTPPGRPFALETHFVVDAIGNLSGKSYFVGIEAAYSHGSTEDGQAECGVQRYWDNVAHTHSDDIEAYATGAAGSRSPLGNGMLGPGAGYTMHAIVHLKQIECRTEGDLGDVGTASLSHTIIDGSVGFEIELTSARIQYVAVYDLSGEP